MSTISGRNSSNNSFYNHPDRRTSLLLHPVGLEVLKEYAKLKKDGLDEVDLDLAEKLAKELNAVVRKKETDISSCLTDAITKHWCFFHPDNTSVLGEKAEAVEGELSQVQASGQPDCVVRMVDLFGSFDGVGLSALKQNGLSELENKQKLVQLIIEVSVDKNGGETKMGQAFEYACLTKDQCKTVLLFTFHVDRIVDRNSAYETRLKITQEAFIYLHSEEEHKRKMGFLWREVYEQEPRNTDDLKFLKICCEGVVRCLTCANHNRDAHGICSNIEYPKEWEASDNVAISSKLDRVYKIFDNRFHPTYRRPAEWLKTERRWIADLHVETEFEFKESETVDTLGRPSPDRKRSRDSDSRKHTPYPNGSVLVIKYKFVKGTHFATKVSHFRDIADCISDMHAENTVHGDIRGFNMLHPDISDTEGGIRQSRLIDFDFSGTPDKDRYPPGYSEIVVDNGFRRSGRAGETLQKVDDWKDLGAVMANYSIDFTEADIITNKAWDSLWEEITEEGTAAAPLLRDFIDNHGDLHIEIGLVVRKKMDKIAAKGTGSPNKLQQQPRGSLSVA